MGEYVSRDGVNGYLCRSEPDTGVGLLIIPHVTGINSEARHECELFPAEGLTTFIWDPYPGLDADTTPREELPLVRDEPSAISTTLCLDYMLKNLERSKVALLGFCMGGRMAINLAAQEKRLASCVSAYPTIRAPKASHEFDAVSLAGKISCPLQILYGGPHHITSNETFARIRDNLDRTPYPKILQVYPGAGHGFMNPARQDEEPNREATKLAWPQMMAFLKASLLS
jgi:carboxymethylenebutenolidase